MRDDVAGAPGAIPAANHAVRFGGAAFIVTSDALSAALAPILLLLRLGAVAVVLSRTRAVAA